MTRRTIASLSLLTVLAACTPVGPPTAAPPSAATASATAAADAATLGTHHWILADATDADGQRIDALFARGDRPLQLDFADGRVLVSNACNRIGGAYALDGDRFSAGPLMSTKMACADAAVMRLDDEIGRRLQAGGTLRRDAGGALLYATSAGERLRFTGKATADTTYGGPGERMFLEVAARRVPCHHPMIPDHRCLHVREITYGDNGIKASTGEWQFLYQEIEGYSHQPGTRNVLRLKRYTLPEPPADGSSVAYVLDMVVESETVPSP